MSEKERGGEDRKTPFGLVATLVLRPLHSLSVRKNDVIMTTGYHDYSRGGGPRNTRRVFRAARVEDS